MTPCSIIADCGFKLVTYPHKSDNLTTELSSDERQANLPFISSLEKEYSCDGNEAIDKYIDDNTTEEEKLTKICEIINMQEDTFAEIIPNTDYREGGDWIDFLVIITNSYLSHEYSPMADNGKIISDSIHALKLNNGNRG